MSILEGDKLGATDSCDGPVAGETAFGEQFPETFCAVGLLVATSEPFTCQTLLTIGTGETFAVPGLVLVGHAATGDHLVAFNTSSSELVLVTLGAIDLLFPRDEALGTDRDLAHATTETFLVPLPCLILHFLRTSSKYLMTSITSRSKLFIVTTSAINTISLGPKLFVYQRFPASGAQETGFVPMFIFVRQILGVDANGSAAFFAGIGKN